MKRFFGANGVPPGDNNLLIPVENFVVFQQDAFFRDDSFAVKPDLVHEGSFERRPAVRGGTAR